MPDSIHTMRNPLAILIIRRNTTLPAIIRNRHRTTPLSTVHHIILRATRMPAMIAHGRVPCLCMISITIPATARTGTMVAATRIMTTGIRAISPGTDW